MPTSTKLTRNCNLGCSYCYQNPARVVHNSNSARDYDIDRILASIDDEWDWETELGRENRGVTVHGGEPLLARKEDLEKLFRQSYEKVGSSCIQTNAVLLDDDHIKLFKTFNVGVGISCDGWGMLNVARQQSGDLNATLKSTAKTLRAIQHLCDVYKPPGLIVVLTKANSTMEPVPVFDHKPHTKSKQIFRPRLLELQRFLDWTQTLGLQGGRLNQAHIDYEPLKSKWELSNDELAHLWRVLVPWAFSNGYKFQPISEIVDGLMGIASITCTKTYCDPLHTDAERAIQSDGGKGNCEHVYGADGVPYQRPEDRKIERHRYDILAQTPWADGGCKGGINGEDGDNVCRWWTICSGECPGHALDGDWRNRTRFCESMGALHEAVYHYLKRVMPNITLLPEVAHRFDAFELQAACHSCQPPWDAFALMDRRYTGAPSSWKCLASDDKYVMHKPWDKATMPTGDVDHGDQPHGDSLHGDYQDHGDHVDES